MSGISGCGGVAMPDCIRQASVADGTGKATVANALKFAVPSRRRHPHFELNVRIIHRLDDTGDATEGGRVSNGLAARRRVRACGNSLRGIDGGGRQSKLFQIIASGRAGGSDAGKQSDSRSVQSDRHFPDRTASADRPLGLQRQRGFSGGAVVEQFQGADVFGLPPKLKENQASLRKRAFAAW
jgi:hypothetical protein